MTKEECVSVPVELSSTGDTIMTIVLILFAALFIGGVFWVISGFFGDDDEEDGEYHE